MIRINSYRIGVGIILLNEEKKVFVGKRIDIKSDAWQMPQGGVIKNEKLEDAAYRELYEETGVKKARIIFKSKKLFFQEKAIFCQYVREMSEKSQGKSKFEIGRHPDSRQQCIDRYINPFLVIFLVIYLCYFGHIFESQKNELNL